MQMANAFKRLFVFNDGGVDSPQQLDAQASQLPQLDATETSPAPLSAMAHPSMMPRRSATFNRVEGFVNVGTTPDQQHLCFSGLLVPGMDREHHLRNRFIFLDYRAEEWFAELCWEMVRNPELAHPVRVRVTGLVGDNRAYVNPCTHSRRQVANEWGRLQEEIRGYPQNLGECLNTEMVCEFIYRRTAEMKNLTIVKWLRQDFTALAVNRSGIIFRMSGAPAIEQKFADGTLNDDLDREIEEHVTVFRTYRV